MTRSDPFTTEIIRNATIKAVEDMRVALKRSAYSPVIYEGLDLACGFVDPNSALIAETSGIPAFLGCLVNVVDATQRAFPLESVEPEDVFFMTDPYDGGGTHVNDAVVAYPVFHHGALIAYSIVKAHVMDLGGIYPGGWYNNTTDTLQEGLRVPPVKLYRRGEADTDIYRIMRTNSRLPDSLVGDVRAMVGAARTGGARLREVIDRYGWDTYSASINEVLDHTERIVRREIEAIPDGDYQAEFFLDGDGDDGQTLGDHLRVHVRVIIDGDEMTVDLSESSDASPGPMNAPRPTSVSYVRYGIKSITTPRLPANEGCFRPLNIILRPGSMFDPKPPSPTSLWVEASQNIPDLMLKALAEAIPHKVRASTFGSDIAQFTYGTDPRSGRFYMIAEESVPGGWGAKPTADGETALHALAEGDTYNIPVEMVETNFPLFVRRYELRPDSAGAGRFRGGLGAVKTLEPVGHDAKLITTFDRSKYSPAWGLFGGLSGAPNLVDIVRADGSTKRHMKVTDMPLREGDYVVFQGGGGGGYGDPFERAPEAVLEDVRNEYVSPASAVQDYGVAIETKNWTVDREATARLRSREGPGTEVTRIADPAVT
jgi:N-methylhydantoinase B